jgi:hypothetical protein
MTFQVAWFRGLILCAVLVAQVLSSFSLITVVRAQGQGGYEVSFSQSPQAEYYSTQYKNYIFFGSSLFSPCCVYAYPNYLYLSSASYSSPTAPQVNFGIGAKNANLTLSGIDPNNGISLNISPNASASTLYVFYYYFPSQNPPSEVVVHVNGYIFGSDIKIGQSAYYTSYSSFLSAQPPAVFWNSTGGYVEASGQTVNTNAIKVILIGTCGNLQNFLSIVDSAVAFFTLAGIIFASIFVISIFQKGLHGQSGTVAFGGLAGEDGDVWMDFGDGSGTAMTDTRAKLAIVVIVALTIGSILVLLIAGNLQTLISC